uniref:Uncharacterized protein n=1 Tax=Anopheles atroparvus TaxID=41427 RepID=A0AAG5D4T0_ANOAO
MTKDRFTPSGTSPSTQQQPAPRPRTALSASATALNTATASVGTVPHTSKLTSTGPVGRAQANLATGNPSTTLHATRPAPTLASPSSLATANQFAKCPSPSGSSSNIAVAPFGPGNRSGNSCAGLGAGLPGTPIRVSPQPSPTSLPIVGSKAYTLGGGSIR